MLAMPFSVLLLMPSLLASYQTLLPSASTGQFVAAVITTFEEATEVQPAAFFVNVYVVAGARPLTVAVVLLPVVDTPPGKRVKVHEPDGKPLNATEPVGIAQVGCVMVPTVGLDGAAGIPLITIFPDAAEVHPVELVTVNV
jgi:hypothetical protein